MEQPSAGGKSGKNVELLAPAGTFEALRAALNAGADAVYLGGNEFGARAYAGNFNRDELLSAIDFAHARDKKIYLAINTLLKDDELEGRMYEYLAPYYEAGLDAVIVQDWGVFDFVKTYFAGLDIHASTQMTVTGPHGAALLKEMGASRVVLARELNVEDIRAIRSNTDIEIECFVHGAMCYSYSGQCLLSSMSGDRSGNRGRCAQPCRMMYDKSYLLSLKDMCSLSQLPDIIEAKAGSLKIEGRMKSSEYVAGVVCIYRKYIDMYFAKGRSEYKTDEQDIRVLSDLYNRGGFSKGYYPGGKGREMISLKRPNHQGTCALEVVSCTAGSAACAALIPLNSGDVFEIDENFNYTVGRDYEAGSRVNLSLPKQYRLKTGRRLYRIHNKSLMDSLNKKYIANDKKISINGAAVLSCGEKAKLTVWKDDVCVEAIGESVQEALKQPLCKEGVYTQLNKTSDTPYTFSKLEILMDENIFMPNRQLNELRRNALERLTKALQKRGQRASKKIDTGKASAEKAEAEKAGTEKDGTELSVNVMLDMADAGREALDFVLALDEVDGIYIEQEAYTDHDRLKTAADAIHKAGKKAYISMPYVVKGSAAGRIAAAVCTYEDIDADAWLIRNLETAAIFKKHFAHAPLIFDAGMYSANRRAVSLYRRQFPALIRSTAPYELTADELEERGIRDSEITVYGYIPVMLSENCVKKTLGQCDAKSGTKTVTDAKGRNFRIASRCQNCYAVMYNSSPLYIGDCADRLMDLKPKALRIIFTNEDAKTMREIINAAGCIRRGIIPEKISAAYTQGHFNRPIL